MSELNTKNESPVLVPGWSNIRSFAKRIGPAVPSGSSSWLQTIFTLYYTFMVKIIITRCSNS